ncbi:MAG: CRISPR-associated endonuclease Cas1 [Burkholderiaceae bacterium]|nr:CRISPR-associated endonuclease Cas1 [Burkholderiaceae bacterium]
MGVLYLDRRGFELRLNAGSLEVRGNGERVQSVPAGLLERVVMRADTVLTSGVLAGLATRGVGVVAISGRGGRDVAHLLGSPHGDVRARVAQCIAACDESAATTWARRLVHGKLVSQRRVIVHAARHRPDLRKPLYDTSRRMDELVARIERCTNRAELRGTEGAGAAAYFRGFTELFAPSLQFHHRVRRPPRDPVNAALSLGYTLLHAEAVSACWCAGLDPMIGLYHRPVHGRESMACDIVEPWRAYVDQWVWDMFRDGDLRIEHFANDAGTACMLGKTGRAHFYAAWANRRRSISRALRRHARLLARALVSSAGLPDWSGDLDWSDEVDVPWQGRSE